MKEIRKRLTYANVMSSLAMFMVLGGGAAVAANGLGKNSVGTPQIKRNAVKVGKLAPEAVKAGKLAKNAVPTNRLRDNAVSAEKIANGSVLTDKFADESVTSSKLAKDSVLTDKILNDAVTNVKIAPNAVSTTKLTDNAVNSAKIQNGQIRAGDLGAIITASNTVNVLNNENGDATVACPAGTVVISGGGFTGSFTNMDLVTTIRSGNGWRVEARNTTGATQPLNVRAYCLVA